MDILIKSFNRPYYLERCIRSIYHFVSGDFQIKVLDDGTAPEYLRKIQGLFPDVVIIYSPYYEQKWKALKEHIYDQKVYNSSLIPSKFWFDQIKVSTSIFLLMEDDIWLTSPINLNHVEQVMLHEEFVFLRLFWQGNKKLINGRKEKVSEGIDKIYPSIPLFNKLILYNEYYLSSILYRLGFIKKSVHFELPFYTLYAVAAAFFDKRYWLYLWDDSSERVDEAYQLRRAYSWFRNKNGQYGKMATEIAQTSYITSATGWHNGVHFDMIYFNHILNEAWLRDELDVLENFPNDFQEVYLKRFIESSNNDNCSYSEWKKWIKIFKSNYQELGCITE